MKGLARGHRMTLSTTTWTSEGPRRRYDWLCELGCLEKIEALEIFAFTYGVLSLQMGGKNPFECLPSHLSPPHLIHSFQWAMYCSLLVSVLISHSFPLLDPFSTSVGRGGVWGDPMDCITVWLLTGFGQWRPPTGDWRARGESGHTICSLFLSSSLT